MTEELLAAMGCGCKVTSEGDTVHVRPCSPEHQDDLGLAMTEVAAKLGIPAEEVFDL